MAGMDYNIEDGALIVLVRGGDKVAESYLINRHYKSLRAYCRNLYKLKADGDDAAHDVCITILGKFSEGSYVERGKFVDWLHSIAWRNARDKTRSKLIFVLFDDLRLDVMDYTEEAVLLNAARWIAIDLEVLKLTLRRQDIFNQHVHELKKFDEIGKSFGKTGGYARSEYSKIVKLLVIAIAVL